MVLYIFMIGGKFIFDDILDYIVIYDYLLMD